MSQHPVIAATLDATGHRCPLPVLMARKALAALAAGAVLEVVANDPGADQDFVAFCELTGHRLVGRESVDGVQRFLIEKAAGG